MDPFIVDFLTAYVASTLVEKLAEFRTSGLAKLKVLFQTQSLELAEQDDGEKPVDPTSTKYIPVTKAGVDCPLLVKSVTAEDPLRLLGYIVVPDSDKVETLDQLRSFLSADAPDIDFDATVLSCTARTIGSDTRTRFAQRIQAREAAEQRDRERMEGFITMPDAVWSATRDGFMASKDKSLIEFAQSIDEVRAELKIAEDEATKPGSAVQ